MSKQSKSLYRELRAIGATSGEAWRQVRDAILADRMATEADLYLEGAL